MKRKQIDSVTAKEAKLKSTTAEFIVLSERLKEVEKFKANKKYRERDFITLISAL